jgi:cell division protein FtsN
MSKAVSKPPSAGKGSPLLVGLLVGVIVGVGMAAGLAWYLMRLPSVFVTPQVLPRLPAEVAKPVTPPTPPASAVGETQPRFEFYKVLTDKVDAPVALPTDSIQKIDKVKPVTKQPDVLVKLPAVVVKSEAVVSAPSVGHAADKQTYYLQLGAFANPDDAENLKAKLSLQGMDVQIQTITLVDKGLMNRVRTGPYHGVDAMNKARAEMKLSGTDSSPIRVP